MYKVIVQFVDLQDNRYQYFAGDIFPRKGMTVSEKRLNELSGSNNALKRPIIEKVIENKISKEISEETSEEILESKPKKGKKK